MLRLASLWQQAVKLPEYQQLLLQHIDALMAALGSIGIDVQGATVGCDDSYPVTNSDLIVGYC
jgi:hypothetical protein